MNTILSGPSDLDINLNINASEMENIISENLLQLSAKSSTIQGNNFTLQLFTTASPIPEMSLTSYIELGECEAILRQGYSIPQTEGLIIKKYDHQIETFVTSQVEFSVFDSSGNELNLSLCDNINKFHFQS